MEAANEFTSSWRNGSRPQPTDRMAPASEKLRYDRTIAAYRQEDFTQRKSLAEKFAFGRSQRAEFRARATLTTAVLPSSQIRKQMPCALAFLTRGRLSPGGAV